MSRAQKIVAKLETFDDDVATDAVEELVELGAPAVPQLHELLSVDAMTRADQCDNGERLYYVLKALRGIGDADGWKPALQLFLDLDTHADGNSNYDYQLSSLIAFAKVSDPARCEPLPDSIADLSAVRASLREAVQAVLSASPA